MRGRLCIGLGGGDDRSIDAVVLFPPGYATWGDVEELADIFRCIFMRDEPEDMLLQVFANVAINHGDAEFAKFTL